MSKAGKRTATFETQAPTDEQLPVPLVVEVVGVVVGIEVGVEVGVVMIVVPLPAPIAFLIATSKRPLAKKERVRHFFWTNEKKRYRKLGKRPTT